LKIATVRVWITRTALSDFFLSESIWDKVTWFSGGRSSPHATKAVVTAQSPLSTGGSSSNVNAIEKLLSFLESNSSVSAKESQTPPSEEVDSPTSLSEFEILNTQLISWSPRLTRAIRHNVHLLLFYSVPKPSRLLRLRLQCTLRRTLTLSPTPQSSPPPLIV
jgi:hypothetical protein